MESAGSIITTLFFVFIIFVCLPFLVGFYKVTQQTAAVIERFGKFQRVARPGLRWRIPLVDRIAGRLSLRIQQLTSGWKPKPRTTFLSM